MGGGGLLDFRVYLSPLLGEGVRSRIERCSREGSRDFRERVPREGERGESERGRGERWERRGERLRQIVDLEEQEYVRGYFQGLEFYERGEWNSMVTTMEKALRQYLAAEEKCRINCDKPFDMGW